MKANDIVIPTCLEAALRMAPGPDRDELFALADKYYAQRGGADLDANIECYRLERESYLHALRAAKGNPEAHTRSRQGLRACALLERANAHRNRLREECMQLARAEIYGTTGKRLAEQRTPAPEPLASVPPEVMIRLCRNELTDADLAALTEAQAEALEPISDILRQEVLDETKDMEPFTVTVAKAAAGV